MGLSCVVRVPGLLLAIAAALACPGLTAQSQPQSKTVAAAIAPRLPARAPAQIDALAVAVSPGANRAVSFTNHRSAFYYTQTHVNDHPEHAWFRGFNIAGRRMFSDYRLTVDGVALDPASSRSVVVRPDALVRTYPNGVVETLRLYDDRDVVSIEVQGSAKNTDLSLAGETVRPEDTVDGVQYYTVTGEAPADPKMTLAVMHKADLFMVCAGATRDAARDLCSEASQAEPAWRAERRTRLESTINGPQFVLADDASLTRSLRWIALTTEQLLTRQRGDGIYAGLPWFPEYWGRDSFIALPGAALVTGHFEAARAILVSFARFQDRDPASRFYGRMPNIVKPGSLDYHTTDGTPRFVIALREYLRYTGDVTLLRELYPNVVASIDGALARFTDDLGLLVHADNETWMDARRASDLSAYVPRGTRANDIQALWYEQLRAGAEFADQLGDAAAARRWTRVADRVRRSFDQLFVTPAARDRPASIADHVTAAGVPDHTLRPNVLFALDLLPANEAAAVTAQAWRTLVFPWGVATLDPGDRFFHPYHLAPGCWHKDEAYHNGTVWPWLDGVLIDQLVRFDQVEPAWQLFHARSRLALARGVVGGLPETLDAYPHPGEAEPRLTGTYLQAWSNAEHLRAWYQDFLGVRPALDQRRVLLRPRIPASLGNVDFTSRVGTGSLRGVYQRIGQQRRFHWVVDGLTTTLVVDLDRYGAHSFEVRAGEQLVVEQGPHGARAALFAVDGAQRQAVALAPSPAHRAQLEQWNAVFSGTRFAEPRPLDKHSIGVSCAPDPAGTGPVAE
jgi:glycogen debranching enzyme